MEDPAKDSNKETSIETTEHMSMDDLTILTESMGFSLVRAQKSLLNSSSGIEGAVDWLIKHQDDKDIDDPIIRVPHNIARLTSTNGELGVVEHYICNRCGKILSRANLDLHADLTGHSSFKESAQNTKAFADGESKNILSKAQDVPEATDGIRRDANMKKAAEKHRNIEQTNHSNQNTEEREKEARLRKAKIVQKDKKEERQRERERIKKQMERDRYEFKAQQRSLQMNVAEDTEEREKEARLRKAKTVQKDKKEERKRERERIMEGIERDRYEFKDEHGLLPPKRQYQTKDRNEGHPSVPKRKKTMYSEATIDKCIGNISSYKALDGRGCLQILAIYMRNILDKPSEDRYKRINMENKAYKTRVKPFVGAKALLLAVGFSLDERDNALILPDDANLEILATAKKKLEIAKDSYLKINK